MASPISEEQRAKLLRSETRSLLQSPDFIRSPVMSQLLSYLVEEAITNPGNPPKAYQVAVDGLGRSEDFDVQADSYPRVQVGRLRKMLAAHYAIYGGKHRLHIPIGHYAAEIEVDESQPEDKLIGLASPDTDQNSLKPEKSFLFSRLDHRQSTFGLAAFFLLIGIGLIWLLNTATAIPADIADDPANYSLPPKIYVISSPRESGETASDRSAAIQNFFADAFARSAQVRLAAGRPDMSVEQGQNSYLFESQVTEGPTGPEVSFSLTSLLKSETIWSTQMALPQSTADYPDKFGSIASRVGSAYGVIATDQRKRLPDDAMTGYSCLLRFESYRANRDPELLPVVESCIEKSLAVDHLDSSMLAAASFLSFLREEATGRKPDPEKALEYARRAMIRGREHASANFALARSSFLNGNCSRGKEFAEKAAALDPYEATIQAQAGAYLFACSDPDALKYLNRAIALDPRGSILAETALVLTLLAEGKDKQALEYAEKIVPSSTGVGPYYDLTMAMVYAKNGRVKESRLSWDRLVAAYGNEKDESPEQLIRRLITNPLLAERAVQLLRHTGIVSTLSETDSDLDAANKPVKSLRSARPPQIARQARPRGPQARG